VLFLIYNRDAWTVRRPWPIGGCDAMKINCWDLIIVLSYVAFNEKYHVNEEMEKDGNVRSKRDI
jgi:hypothetical protein